jgi:hypothetical protein
MIGRQSRGRFWLVGHRASWLAPHGEKLRIMVGETRETTQRESTKVHRFRINPWNLFVSLNSSSGISSASYSLSTSLVHSLRAHPLVGHCHFLGPPSVVLGSHATATECLAPQPAATKRWSQEVTDSRCVRGDYVPASQRSYSSISQRVLK